MRLCLNYVQCHEELPRVPMTAAMIPELSSCPNCGAQWERMIKCYKCHGTGVNPKNGAVCDVHACSYNPAAGDFDGPCTAHCCREGQRGPFSAVVGVQYSDASDAYYDGVSEWKCPACEIRWGRWSGRVLAPGEVEMPFSRAGADAPTAS